MSKSMDLLKSLAMAGARARMAEIEQTRLVLIEEEQGLLTIIGNIAGVAPKDDRAKRTTMNDAQRKAVSLRMKKYWAKRRRDAKTTKGKG